MSINEDLLNEDPDSLVIEADESIQYEPDTESNVVATEPLIVTIGRKKRKDALKDQSM